MDENPQVPEGMSIPADFLWQLREGKNGSGQLALNVGLN